MLLLNLIIYCSIIEGVFSQLFDDVVQEKLFTQFAGVVNYMFRIEEAKPIRLDVTFNLYTRRNPQIPQVLVDNHPSLLKISNFNPKLQTYFVIHGYTDHKDREIIAKLRTALNMAEDANVIVVDWKRLAGFIYFNAAEGSLIVGKYLGDFLLFLENNLVNLEKVHLIGHSLGAQISGIAGAVVQGRLGRITGLDPAGPYFEFIHIRNNSESLDITDAKFVDVIHTNGGEFGIMNPAGHADFYPNDGVSPQPGCNNILTIVSCSHIRSVLFYTESITSQIPFESRTCNVENNGSKCLQQAPVVMGHHCKHTTRGIYYLTTNDAPPFAQGSQLKPRIKDEL